MLPKVSENEMKDMEILKEREELEKELGQLTYKIGCCVKQITEIQEQAVPLRKRANEIATKLEIMDRGISNG